MTEGKTEQNKKTFSRRKFLKVGAGGALSLSLLKGKTASSRESHQPQNHLEKIRLANVSREVEVQTQQELRQDIRLSSLSIPSIGIENLNVGSAELDLTANEWKTPEYGAVTPEDNFWPNISWVYGHISYDGKPGVFNKLPQANIGDNITVEGKNLNQGRVQDDGHVEYPPTGELNYKITDILLTDRSTFRHLIFEMASNGGPKLPTLLLQTSIRVNGSSQWLTDRESLLKKAKVQIDTDIDDLQNYLIEVVVAQRDLSKTTR